MERDVSPPPLKRRRISKSQTLPKRDTPTLPIGTTPGKEQLSIYSWNVNGIQPFTQRPITAFFKDKSSSPSSGSKTPATASLRDFLRRHGWPQLLFLQEVKINPSDDATIRAVGRSVRAPSYTSEPDYVAHFCLPSDPYNARGFGRKIYGVCCIVRSDFLSTHVARIRSVDWDLEGRFQVIETRASPAVNTPKLSIWNIYAVNGTDNPYRDPKTVLSLARGTTHEGYQIILAGDLNIARGLLDGYPNLRTSPAQHVRNRADFNAKFFDDKDGFKGVDTFRQLHGEKLGYTYYPRGAAWGSSCDRVDLIICSQGLKGDLVGAGMLASPQERGPSDHVPLFAEFRFGEQEDEERKEGNNKG
ncbi:hypothetical protein H2203_000532 [Taxawa tesnikishii (nom. ined.)]|nr:hypothetical protein H2203_000532 [Dothideales sp. JES 119]